MGVPLQAASIGIGERLVHLNGTGLPVPLVLGVRVQHLPRKIVLHICLCGPAQMVQGVLPDGPCLAVIEGVSGGAVPVALRLKCPCPAPGGQPTWRIGAVVVDLLAQYVPRIVHVVKTVVVVIVYGEQVAGGGKYVVGVVYLNLIKVVGAFRWLFRKIFQLVIKTD